MRSGLSKIENVYLKTLVFEQESDCNAEQTSDQLLTFKIENNGIGEYLVIETERFAIDAEDIPKFCDFLLELKTHMLAKEI